LNIELRRAADRLESHADGIVSRHSFAFGPHYDPTNTRFGALVTNNDDVLAPGAGFPEHPHRDLEIVTWVVSGALQHTDSSGGSAILRPGMVGRLSTGGGVRHSETNAWSGGSGGSGKTRYVQMWILPDAEGLPSYCSADVSSLLEGGAFVAVASGSEPAPVTVRCNATLYVARLTVGISATIPASALLHVFVARGSVLLSTENQEVQLLSEDAARLTGAIDVRVAATADAELLAWAMS
jgi:redox-sensitive bicupin YhaK (pirin superfamily)